MMELLILIFSLWGIGKGVKTLFRSAPRRTKANHTKPAPTVTTAFHTLTTLQEQRECIKESLAWTDDLIRMEEKPENVLKWMTKRAQLKGQLATVQAKIDKLIY